MGDGCRRRSPAFPDRTPGAWCVAGRCTRSAKTRSGATRMQIAAVRLTPYCALQFALDPLSVVRFVCFEYCEYCECALDCREE